MDINSIYFLLTPNCNLNCKYCFQETSYHMQHSVMASREIVDDFVEYCTKNKINHVELFGGEPLLYKDLFEYTVETLFNKIPDLKIGVVTNGTLIDEKIMKMFETRSISLLLSLDGQEERHDSMRGGFARIKRWFPRLAAMNSVTIAIQGGIIPGLYDNIRYLWHIGFRNGVYINVIQNYGWYSRSDVEFFEKEYEKTLQGMLRGEGVLVCAMQLHELLTHINYPQVCGITARGLACDWRGMLYPCHRAMELGPQFSIGDICQGVDENVSRRVRTHIQKSVYKSKTAKNHPLWSFCPVTIYQKHLTFIGRWCYEFCEMIEIKAKLVAKYYYEIDKHCEFSKNRNISPIDKDLCNLS